MGIQASEYLRSLEKNHNVSFDRLDQILREQQALAGLAEATAPGQPLLISSYHPSQQNTSTGKLTPAMFRAVFERARRHLAAASEPRA